MGLLNCDATKSLAEILGDGCNDKGGVLRMAWADASDLTAVTWDDDQITGFTFAGAGFNELRIDPENSQFFDEYTKDAGCYEQTALLYFKALKCATRDKLSDAVGLCPIVLVAELANCQVFVMGIHKRGASGFEIQYPMPLEPTRHRNDAGQMGGDRSRHEFELTGKSLQAMHCWDDDFDELPGIGGGGE